MEPVTYPIHFQISKAVLISRKISILKIENLREKERGEFSSLIENSLFIQLQ